MWARPCWTAAGLSPEVRVRLREEGSRIDTTSPQWITAVDNRLGLDELSTLEASLGSNPKTEALRVYMFGLDAGRKKRTNGFFPGFRTLYSVPFHLESTSLVSLNNGNYLKSVQESETKNPIRQFFENQFCKLTSSLSLLLKLSQKFPIFFHCDTRKLVPKRPPAYLHVAKRKFPHIGGRSIWGPGRFHRISEAFFSASWHRVALVCFTHLNLWHAWPMSRHAETGEFQHGLGIREPGTWSAIGVPKAFFPCLSEYVVGFHVYGNLITAMPKPCLSGEIIRQSSSTVFARPDGHSSH